MKRRSIAAITAVAMAIGACIPPAAACPDLAGGEPAAAAQLRWVGFGDDQVSLLFGLRAGEPFGIPAHRVDGSAAELRVRLPGARLRYPDGSASYLGERALHPPRGRIHEVRVDEDADGVVIVLRSGAPGCARLASRRYGLGTTHPAALVSIALRHGPVIALDRDRGQPGYPMQVIGLGFQPSSPVAFQAAGRQLWTSTSDASGHLDTVLVVPDLPVGDHSALARDPREGAAAWFRVEGR